VRKVWWRKREGQAPAEPVPFFIIFAVNLFSQLQFEKACLSLRPLRLCGENGFAFNEK